MQVDTLVPVSKYLSTSYRPDREYLDGVLLERNLGERDHSTIQMFLSAYLFNRRQQWGVAVLPEQRVQITPTRFRVPDVCVIHAGLPFEPIVASPPLICIEILSKDDTMSQMQERISDYLRFGVPHVWVIDPDKRRAWDFSAAGMNEAAGALRADEIMVPLEEIFLS